MKGGDEAVRRSGMTSMQALPSSFGIIPPGNGGSAPAAQPMYTPLVAGPRYFR